MVGSVTYVILVPLCSQLHQLLQSNAGSDRHSGLTTSGVKCREFVLLVNQLPSDSDAFNDLCNFFRDNEFIRSDNSSNIK